MPYRFLMHDFLPAGIKRKGGRTYQSVMSLGKDNFSLHETIKKTNLLRSLWGFMKVPRSNSLSLNSQLLSWLGGFQRWGFLIRARGNRTRPNTFSRNSIYLMSQQIPTEELYMVPTTLFLFFLTTLICVCMSISMYADAVNLWTPFTHVCVRKLPPPKSQTYFSL